jgi:molecular chaperone GrpE
MTEQLPTDDATQEPGAQEPAGGPAFKVRDRRWWADEQAEPEDAPAQDRKPSYVEELERQLAEARQAVDETRARHRGALDELERARERIERAAARAQEQRHREVLASFLAVVDDLDRALAAVPADAPAQTAAIADGVRLVHKRMLGALGEHGVTTIDAEGAPFDPARHEAVAVVEVDDPARDGTVVAVHRPGYRLGDDTLRPALVAVGKSPAS